MVTTAAKLAQLKAKRHEPTFEPVPRLWPDATVVCLATGPSLCAEDIAACRGRAVLLAVKDAIRLAPDADVLYCADAKWFNCHANTLPASSLRYSLERESRKWATVLKNTGELGLETDPTGLRTGRNSGFQAINLAVHLGARRIVLLGYDMKVGPRKEAHFFGSHPYASTPIYAAFVPLFHSLVAPLRSLGIAILNASRVSALTCFPKVSLAEALA